MIKISNLGKQFVDSSGSNESGESNWVFRGVNLNIGKNDSVSLVGPSGGGKSVLLKIVAGMLDPTEGNVELGTSNIGMLFQKNALFDSLTVLENLLFPLEEVKKVKGEAALKRARHFLDQVGLAPSENNYPHEISGGMQKRLGIARALIVEPEIILYDEPTAGLDPITSRKIADMIIGLRREVGSTLLTVTTDMQRAYQIGDRVYLLAQGQLMDGGTPEQIQQSTHPAIRQFIFGLKEGPLTSRLD